MACAVFDAHGQILRLRFAPLGMTFCPPDFFIYFYSRFEACPDAPHCPFSTPHPCRMELFCGDGFGVGVGRRRCGGFGSGGGGETILRIKVTACKV
jgi:hypothetical protein